MHTTTKFEVVKLLVPNFSGKSHTAIRTSNEEKI